MTRKMNRRPSPQIERIAKELAYEYARGWKQHVPPHGKTLDDYDQDEWFIEAAIVDMMTPREWAESHWGDFIEKAKTL